MYKGTDVQYSLKKEYRSIYTDVPYEMSRGVWMLTAIGLSYSECDSTSTSANYSSQ